MIGSCDDSSTQPFAKTICSICYEDLKPTVEDLQAISVCGHVFHELCIQQWFEYCSKGKKNCPICKQTCSASNVNRLYFQSVGDSNGSNLSQKLQTDKDDPGELNLEVRRLEAKISGLTLALESKETALINLRDDEQLKKEASLKNVAMGHTRKIHDLLVLKIDELKKSEQERTKLQEKNKVLQEEKMKLAKEVAAFMLLYDLNLSKSKIAEAASLLTEHHSKDDLDIFAKSLDERNKMYKELMTKYKTLGGDEACTRKEREKGEKISKVLERLKEKTRQMETAKAPKKTKDSPSVLHEVDPTLNATCTPQDTIQKPDVHLRETKRSRVSEITTKSYKDGDSSYILVSDDDDDDEAPKGSISPESPSYDSVSRPTKRTTTDDDMACVFEAESVFTTGVLGLDGTKRHLGTYCKKGFNISSVPTQSSSNLINIGPDGRGGTMKVLKPLIPFSNVSRGSLVSSKKSKLGAKTSSLQYKGSLKINHFFTKAGP